MKFDRSLDGGYYNPRNPFLYTFALFFGAGAAGTFTRNPWLVTSVALVCTAAALCGSWFAEKQAPSSNSVHFFRPMNFFLWLSIINAGWAWTNLMR